MPSGRKSNSTSSSTPHGPRPADDVLSVEPTQAVERAVAWEPAELEKWIRDGGIWYGQIRDRDGHVALVPRADLRPAGQEIS